VRHLAASRGLHWPFFVLCIVAGGFYLWRPGECFLVKHLQRPAHCNKHSRETGPPLKHFPASPSIARSPSFKRSSRFLARRAAACRW
jgi:hypothetical protein